MQTLNQKRVALVFGSFVAITHLVWSVIVGFGWAESFLDFIFGMHFIVSPHIVLDFNLATAVGLIVLAFAVAYVVGYIFATIWNHFHKE